MPILEKVCISLYLGFPFHWPQRQPELTGLIDFIGPYLLPIGPYLVPIGPYLIPIWPYWALFGRVGPYLALTVKQKRDTEGSHRGHRSNARILQ